MASTNPSTPTKPKPNDKQLELLGAIMQNCQGKLDIHWDEVAAQAGYKSAASAREIFRQLSKKFGWNSGTGTGAGTSTSTSTSTPSTPKSAKVEKNQAKPVGGAKRGRGRPPKNRPVAPCKSSDLGQEGEDHHPGVGASEEAGNNKACKEEEEEEVKTEGGGGGDEEYAV